MHRLIFASHSVGHFDSSMVELRITQLQSSLECAEQITSHMHRLVFASHSVGHFDSSMVELRITQLQSSLKCAE